MTVDRTRLEFNALDRERARLALDDDLVLQKFVVATGNETVLTITEGWAPKKDSDSTVSAEIFEVEIAENGADLAPTFRGKISHVEFGGYRYKVSGVEQPKSAIKVWVVRAESTGERV